jgi:hypothetical protein
MEFGVSLADIARRIGRSARHITGRLALLELPRKVQANVDSGEVTVTDATALLALKDRPDVIVHLLEDDWSRSNLERAVVREVQRFDTERKVSEAREALTTEGVAIIDEWSRYGGRSRQPAALGDRPGELDIPARSHRGEPCHAAHVTTSGEVVLLCTDPGRHRPGGDSGVRMPNGAAPTRTEDRGREQQEASQRREVERERRAFLSGLLAQRIPQADVWSIVCSQYLAGARNTHVKNACDLLSLEPTVGQFGPDHRRALELYAAASGANHDRAALALALAAGDEALRFANDDHPTAGVLAHTDFLAAYGWKPGGDQHHRDADGAEAGDASEDPVKPGEPQPATA